MDGNVGGEMGKNPRANRTYHRSKHLPRTGYCPAAFSVEDNTPILRS